MNTFEIIFEFSKVKPKISYADLCTKFGKNKIDSLLQAGIYMDISYSANDDESLIELTDEGTAILKEMLNK